MITLSGIRCGSWCSLAFAIVACASAPMPTDEALQRHPSGTAVPPPQ